MFAAYGVTPNGDDPLSKALRGLIDHVERQDEQIERMCASLKAAGISCQGIDENDKPAKGGGRDAGQGGPPPVTVVQMFERLSNGPLAGLRLGLMHGRLAAEDKDAVMAAFRAGDIDVLVCTTVIEVGVDVPNATVMVVMDADRFGISQLHQLRGRIGRGQHPSLCLLATNLPETSKAGQRLRAVAGTLDGFALADLDLLERSEGDVLGLHQSGRAITLRFLSLALHREIIETAKELCEKVFDQDPQDPGMAVLSAPFVDADRVQYLDMS